MDGHFEGGARDVDAQKAVIPAKAGIRYAAALAMTALLWILDHPPEPVIRPAEGRIGWRVMTAVMRRSQRLLTPPA